MAAGLVDDDPVAVVLDQALTIQVPENIWKNPFNHPSFMADVQKVSTFCKKKFKAVKRSNFLATDAFERR